MDPRFRKVAVFVGAAALATGVGVGVASQGNGTASSPGASSQLADAPGARGAPGDRDLSALAEKLGVTTDKLHAAMEAARSSTGGVPQPGDRDAMAAALAKELGLSTDKVSAALESLRPQGAPGGTPPSGAAPPDGSTAPNDSTTGTTTA
jgi:Clp amino terminal domain, pathogenicity island component